ncbi:MAG: transcriptional repressor [Chlorobiaceae bacterium]|nr:transcriptional repressor [Chlorobiaceae bacterium]
MAYKSTSTNNGMERFIDRCRQEGLKVTPQRIAIYQVLMGSRNHPSADTVYREMTGTHPTISFDTVNRTLLTFAGIGVINTVESYSGSRRFDTETEPHHHVHCVKCGRISDFNDLEIDALKVPERITREFDIIGHRMVVSGICTECGKKMMRDK